VIVLDASVLVKLFKNEEDSALARQFIDIQLLDRKDAFLAPSVLIYEALSAALHVEQPFDRITSLLDHLRTLGLMIEEPEATELILAEKIARTEAPGGGFPTLFDSIYHAMAIERHAMLITADRRHFAKAGNFGHITLLADWRPD
jgi:predicted nucleic acid-binding protein